jgi:site-specific recombinase XerD
MRTQQSIRHLVDQYIHYLMQTGHRFEQVITTHGQLDYFTEWADRRHIVDIDQLEYALASDYCDHLQSELDLFKEKPIPTRIFRERLTKLRRFYDWLYRKGHAPIDLSKSVPRITKAGEVSGDTTSKLADLVA